MGQLRMHRHTLPMSRPAMATRTTATERTRGDKWMRTRERIFARACGLCQCTECKDLQRVRLAHEVDHIVPLELGGSDGDANLQAINADCHKVKTAREARERAGMGRPLPQP